MDDKHRVVKRMTQGTRRSWLPYGAATAVVTATALAGTRAIGTDRVLGDRDVITVGCQWGLERWSHELG
ncbi:hypothetical protein ACWERI_33065 [Streptomyces collinus]